MDTAHVYQRGFTLVELTIVLAIIGILATGFITVINIPVQLQKARDGQRKSDVLNIKSALEIYRTDQRTYPASLPACGQPLTGGVPAATYIQRVPCETKGGWSAYTYVQSGSGYTLTACLERNTDIDATGEVCSTNGKQYVATSP